MTGMDKILPGDSNKQVKWTGLDKTDSEGNEYTYTVKEVPVPNFIRTQTGNDITNTYKLDKIDVSASKTWVGGSAKRPASITFKL